MSQLIVKKFYESQGWKIHNQGSQWRRIGSRWFPVGNDIWGAFDLLGMHAEHGFLFVQSKTGGSGIQEAKRRIEALPWPRDERGEVSVPRCRVVIVVVKKHVRSGRRYGTYLRVLRWFGVPDTWVVETVELHGGIEAGEA